MHHRQSWCLRCYSILLLYIVYKCSVFIIDGCGVGVYPDTGGGGQSCSVWTVQWMDSRGVNE